MMEMECDSLSLPDKNFIFARISFSELCVVDTHFQMRSCFSADGISLRGAIFLSRVLFVFYWWFSSNCWFLKKFIFVRKIHSYFLRCGALFRCVLCG